MAISRPGVSKHLRVLRVESLTEVDAWLAPYRQLWAQRVDALERHLDDG
jgi:hypothetical protein